MIDEKLKEKIKEEADLGLELCQKGELEESNGEEL